MSCDGGPGTRSTDGGGRARRGAALLAGAAAALPLAASGLLGDPAASARALAWEGACSASLLALVALAFGLAQRRPLADALALVRPAASGPRIALYAVGALGWSHVLDLAARASGSHAGSSLAALERGLAAASGGEVPLLLVGVAALPAIGEELLFRGALLQGLSRRLGVAAAWLVSSLLFAAVHLDPLHSLAALPLGLYLGACALAARSLWPAIVAHAANNAVAVLSAGSGVGESAWVVLGAGVAAGLAVAQLARDLRAEPLGETSADTRSGR